MISYNQQQIAIDKSFAIFLAIMFFVIMEIINLMSLKWETCESDLLKSKHMLNNITKIIGDYDIKM